MIAKTMYQYNANNQLTSITHKDAADLTLVSHGYTYDAGGNIAQYVNSIDGAVTYDYDFLGQLLGAQASSLQIEDESYTYDANGNRTMTGYTTGANNEMSSDGAYVYTYDAEGNRISKTNATGTQRELYAWDYRNRLTTVTAQTYNAETETWTTVQIVEYAYDYNNVLIRKRLDENGDGTFNDKTIFLPENYQTAIQLDWISEDAGETPALPVVTHRYLWTPQNQDKLIADVTPTETLWALSDHLGTIRDVYQQTASGLLQKSHLIYDAYGNVLSCKDSNGQTIDNPTIFGFTGKYFDVDTKLQNNINRWYDATTGRWLSPDPIGFNGNDTNLYRYVGNKINLQLDIFGLSVNDIVKIICERLIDKIRNMLKDLEERMYEYKMDFLHLPERAPGDDKFPRKSRWGHRELYREKLQIFRKMLEEFKDTCGNYKRPNCTDGIPWNRIEKLVDSLKQLDRTLPAPNPIPPAVKPPVPVAPPIQVKPPMPVRPPAPGILGFIFPGIPIFVYPVFLDPNYELYPGSGPMA